MADKKPAKKAAAKRTAKTTTKSAAKTTKSATKRATKQATVTKKSAVTKKTVSKKAVTKKSVATATKQPASKRPTTKRAATKRTTTTPTTTPAAAEQAAPARTDVRKATGKQQMPEQLAERASALAVREDESPWSPDELREVLSELRADADRLRGEILDVENELDDMLRNTGEGAGDDQADAGSKTFEREHEMYLVAHARDMLAQTERAMARIKAGTYGNCEGCDRAIGKERLRAYPRATLCVSCKQREERR